MSSQNRRSTVRRSLPLPGILSLIVGFGLLLSYWKFQPLSYGWSRAQLLLFFGLAVVLVYWGLNQVLASLVQPPASPRRKLLSRNRVMLPREGFVYLSIMAVMFVGSLLGHSNMLMLIFAMMAGPFVLNGQITFILLRKTKVTRRLPQRTMAGEQVSVEVVLENRKRFLSAYLMTARDQITNLHERLSARVLFARVPPREKRTGYYQMRLMQRGKYFLGPIELTTRFPLGLVERGLLFQSTDEIIVHPRIGQLSPTWKREHLLADELVQRHATRSGTFDDEFHAMREYRWGDNPRAIHWRTSARQTEIMVREYHQSRDHHLAMILDLWLPKRPTQDDFDRVELAVSFAATVGVEHFRNNRDSTLYFAASGETTVQWKGSTASSNLELLLDTLALIEAGPSRDVNQLRDDLDNHRLPNSHNILITTRKSSDGTLTDFSESHLNGNLIDPGHEIHLIEADPCQLASYFSLE